MSEICGGGGGGLIFRRPIFGRGEAYYWKDTCG